MNQILISVKESTAQRLQELAAATGIPIEQEASDLLDGAVNRADRIHSFLCDVDRFAAGLPPQHSDSADLIRRSINILNHPCKLKTLLLKYKDDNPVNSDSNRIRFRSPGGGCLNRPAPGG